MDVSSLPTESFEMLDAAQPGPPRIRSFGVDHRLVERRFQYRTPDIHADELEGRFLVVPTAMGKTRVSDVMLIDGEGRITHVARDAGSHTGWWHDPWHGLTRPEQSLVSFPLGEDTIAFWWTRQGRGGVAIRHRADGTWAPDHEVSVALLAGAVDLKHPIVQVTADGSIVVSGWFAVDEDATRFQWGFSYLRSGTSAWVHQRVVALERTVGQLHWPLDVVSVDLAKERGELSLLVMVSVNAGYSWWAARYTFAHTSGTIRMSQGSTPLSETRRIVQARAIKPRAAHRLQYVQRLQDGSLQVVDRDLTAWRTPGVVVPLSGEPGMPKTVRQWRLSVVDKLCWIYALDEQLRLWTVREIGRDESGAVRFGAWTELGDRLRYLDARSETAFEPEFFAATFGNRLERFVRDPASGTWTRETIENEGEHTTKTVDMAAFATEVACFSAPNVAAMAGRLVEVSATRATDAFINGVSHHLEPNSSVPCETDEAGRVTIWVRATSLTAPTLKIGSPDLATHERLAVRPDVHAHEQLSRVAAASLTAPLPEGTFSGQTVLAPRLHGQAEQFASAVRNTGTLLLKEGEQVQGDASALDRPWLRDCAYRRGLEIIPAEALAGFQVRPDFSYVTVPHWTWSFGGAADTTAYSEISVGEAEAAWASADGVLTELGDLFHRLKNAVSEAVHVVVSVVERTVHFVVTIAGKIYRCIADTLQHIGQFLEVLFAQMAASFAQAFERVLDWLKERIGWSDILLTKDFFKGVFSTIGSGVERDLQLLPGIIDRRYNEFVGTLDAQFDAWTAQLQATPNVRSIVSKIGRPPPSFVSSNGSYLNPDSMNRTAGASRVHTNTVYGLAFSSPDARLGSALAPVLAELSPAQLDIVQRFKAELDDLAAAGGTLLDGMRQFFRDVGSQPDGIVDASLLPLLAALKDLVRAITGAVRKVLVLLSEVVAALAETFGRLMAKPLEIPVLSALYRTLTGSELTLLDLGSLLIAAPCTVLFKALGFGGTENGRARAPFADRAALDAALGVFVWPTIAEDGTLTVAPIASSDVQAGKVILAAFGAAIALSGIVTTTALDGMAKMNFEKPTLPGPAEILTVVSLLQNAAAAVCAWPFFYAVPGNPTTLESVAACTWLVSVIAWSEHVMSTIMVFKLTGSLARPRVAGAAGIVVSGMIDVQQIVMGLLLLGFQLVEITRRPGNAALWLTAIANFFTMPRYVAGILIIGTMDTNWGLFVALEAVAGVADVIGGGVRCGLVVFAGQDEGAPELLPAT